MSKKKRKIILKIELAVFLRSLSNMLDNEFHLRMRNFNLMDIYDI